MNQFTRTTFQNLSTSEYSELDEFLDQFRMEPDNGEVDEIWWENYVKEHPELLQCSSDIPF